MSNAKRKAKEERIVITKAEKKLFLWVIGMARAGIPNIRPDQKAALTRAERMILRSESRGRPPVVVQGQEPLDIQFRCLPPSIKRRRRSHWARYPYEMVQEARRLRQDKGWTYRDIAESLNAQFGTTVNWITIRDWTAQAYRVTG